MTVFGRISLPPSIEEPYQKMVKGSGQLRVTNSAVFTMLEFTAPFGQWKPEARMPQYSQSIVGQN